MPSRLIASYTSYVTIEIPKDVQSYLLSVEENVIEKEGQPGSWYILWGDLHYYDKEGKEQVIEGGEPDGEFKRPNTVEEENDATPVVNAHQKMMEFRKKVENDEAEAPLTMEEWTQNEVYQYFGRNPLEALTIHKNKDVDALVKIVVMFMNGCPETIYDNDYRHDWKTKEYVDLLKTWVQQNVKEMD